MSERTQKYRNLLGSVDINNHDDKWNCDNLSIALASYFESLPCCPEDDTDVETGWSKWAMKQTDTVLDTAIDEVVVPLLDRIEKLEDFKKKVGELPRVGIIGGQEQRALYGRSMKSAKTGETSELYIRVADLQALIEKEKT